MKIRIYIRNQGYSVRQQYLHRQLTKAEQGVVAEIVSYPELSGSLQGLSWTIKNNLLVK